MIINSKIYNVPLARPPLELEATTRLVIISSTLTDLESELLNKMISASGLKSSEYKHFITNNDNIYVKYLSNRFDQLKIISFNVNGDKLGIQAQIKKIPSLWAS